MNNRPSYYSVTSLTEEFGTTDLEPIPHSRVRVLICFVYFILDSVSNETMWVHDRFKIWPTIARNSRASRYFRPQASETVVGLLIKICYHIREKPATNSVTDRIFNYIRRKFPGLPWIWISIHGDLHGWILRFRSYP